jgi:signal transduction histidine kinase
LGNAFLHSGASKIEVEITYDRVMVRLRIRDDGRGIDSQILNGGRPGHYGLSGMRERAHTLGARLDIWSRPGAGTEVDLAIPAEAAYEGGFRSLSLQWISGLMGGRKERG